MRLEDAIKEYSDNVGILNEMTKHRLAIEDYVIGVLDILYGHDTLLSKSIFYDLKRNGKLVECFYNAWFFENSIRDFMENYETIKEEKVVGYERIKPKMVVSVKEITKVNKGVGYERVKPKMVVSVKAINKGVDLDAPSTTKASTYGGIV